MDEVYHSLSSGTTTERVNQTEGTDRLIHQRVGFQNPSALFVESSVRLDTEVVSPLRGRRAAVLRGEIDVPSTLPSLVHASSPVALVESAIPTHR